MCCNSSVWALEGQFVMKMEPYLSFLIFTGKQFNLISPIQLSWEVLLQLELSDAMQDWDGQVDTQMQTFFFAKVLSIIVRYPCHTKSMTDFPVRLLGQKTDEVLACSPFSKILILCIYRSLFPYLWIQKMQLPSIWMKEILSTTCNCTCAQQELLRWQQKGGHHPRGRI